jgi:phage/conjugal plasmid C-4 type zinc finger TraR family protein
MADFADMADGFAEQAVQARAAEVLAKAQAQRDADPGPVWIEGRPCCRECEEPIPLARLQAVPGTGLCRECAP